MFQEDIERAVSFLERGVRAAESIAAGLARRNELLEESNTLGREGQRKRDEIDAMLRAHYAIGAKKLNALIDVAAAAELVAGTPAGDDVERTVRLEKLYETLQALSDVAPEADAVDQRIGDRMTALSEKGASP